MQRLLFYQLSRLGGKLASADVNADGNDDVFLGGASGQPGMLYMGQDKGTFVAAVSQPWKEDAASEDMESLFFDADRDGDMDLYVVSGGSEFVPGAPMYQDRLYVNDGRGNFKKTAQALPAETTSGSCVAAADYDKDGDLDIFVGGRHSPASYGVLPRSYLLRNDSKQGIVQFTDETKHVSSDLVNPGMVTAAVWTDFNQDSWPDLIVTGEWMPVRIFENQKGKLVERKNIASLEKSNGWWCHVHAADVDKDGDTDLILGNAGINMQFKASAEQPVQMYVNDFNKDGALDPLLCHYIQGKSYPLPSRDELLDQVGSLRKKFIKYADYADATVHAIADEETIQKSYQFNAYELRSCWLENIDGKEFALHALPPDAQVSSVNGSLVYDVDKDNENELLLAGNFYSYKPQLGQSDASMGVVLEMANGTFQTVADQRARIWLTGDIRDMALLKFKSGARRLVVSRNNNRAGVYAFEE
jgi:hypothetical protein